jgi:hypothetical protein
MLDPDPYPDPHQINADPKPWFCESENKKYNHYGHVYKAGGGG